MRTRVALALAGAGVVLAGCSDGGGSSGGGGDDRPSYAELEARVERLGDALEDEALTDIAVLPTSGSARYEGLMGVGIGRGDEVLLDAAGEAELVVRFGDAADPIGGGATSLVTADDEAVAGSLDFSNGVLDRNGLDGEVIAFDIDGTLSADGATYDVEGRAFGDFLGEDYDYAVALGGGAASERGVGEADFLGAFIGER